MRIVVVGAGVIGLCTAIELRRAGCEVVLLDSGKAGAGASSAAMGSLTPYSDHEADADTHKLALSSLAQFPAYLNFLHDVTGVRVDFDTRGVFELALSERDDANLKALKVKKFQSDPEVVYLDRKSTLELEPSITNDFFSSLWYKSESVVDVKQYMRALKKCALKLGVQILEHTPVIRAAGMSKRIETVQSNTRTFGGDYFVIAAGASVDSISGLKAPVQLNSIRGEVIEVKGAPGLVGGCIYAGDGFITPRRDGRLLLGSNYHEYVPGDDINRKTILASSALSTLLATTRLVPAIAECQLVRVWKAWRPKSPSSQPWIMRDSEFTNLFWSIGYYGLGITNSIEAAKLIKQKIIG